MITQGSSNNIDNLLKQILQQRPQKKADIAQSTVTTTTTTSTASKAQDIVSISGQNKLNTKQSTLVSEKRQETENGFQKIQEFENAQGRKFTRIEEIETTDDRSKRVVIQQNDSGNTTLLENVLDRQDDGTFRLIERFTDETGETKTNVTLDFNPKDADILLGRPSTSQTAKDNPFQNLRGTQVDLTV